VAEDASVAEGDASLKHLAAAGMPALGPANQGWAGIALTVLLIAVLAGAVAIWNRSRYRP
jgi:hypothetical protein